jgi:phosphatidylserine decarboxylase
LPSDTRSVPSVSRAQTELVRQKSPGSAREHALPAFNRDPERIVPSGDNLVSPSDGVIKEIIYENNITYYILGLSFWDVHVVRTPVSGVVKNIEHEGLVLSRKSETENQVYLDCKDGPVQAVVTIGSDHGDIKVRLITSYFAKRLQLSVQTGARATGGETVILEGKNFI